MSSLPQILLVSIRIRYFPIVEMSTISAISDRGKLILSIFEGTLFIADHAVVYTAISFDIFDVLYKCISNKGRKGNAKGYNMTLSYMH